MDFNTDETGVLKGRQHHTLDMELFGPNSWLTSMYLAALKAIAIMGEAMGEAAFAQQCSDMAEKGGALVDGKPGRARGPAWPSPASVPAASSAARPSSSGS